MRKISFTYQHRKDGFIFITCYFSSMKYVWLKKFNRLKHKIYTQRQQALYCVVVTTTTTKNPKEFPFFHS